MSYQVTILPSAQRELGRLPAQERRRVDKRIQALAFDPRPPGAIAMQGSSKGLLRFRAGDYRIIYQVEDKRLMIVVVKVGHRRDIYR
ncbi:mRNA interferase RelE [uncultured Leptolyngbya sp.]|uniref:mRNA interferase RelE n=1 Tax=uncultured Leptolyngbya sp. TaxID=332963 RepID=A0A6J4MV17_9CYAN|nr:mRNA interferase RelE [uncultured Leptolyngbya sp.]